MTAHRSGAAAVAIFATAVALTACTSPAPGPLGFGGEIVTQCVPVASGGSVLVGDVLTAPPDSDIAVTSVTAVDRSGVDVESTYLMDVVDGAAIGTATMPPDDPPPAWDDRVDAEGATVGGGSQSNLLLVVTRTGSAEGSIGALRVEYSVDGVTYVKTGTTTYEFADSC